MRLDQQPSTPWVESDQVEAYLDAVGADAAQRRFVTDLHRDGVAVIDLGPEGRALCDEVTAQTARFFTLGVRRVQDAWRRSPAARALSNLPVIDNMLTLAYGRRPFAFQTLNFVIGSEQSAHADAVHFHCEPQRFMCGVWFALEDVAADAGPLFYHLGSHKRPVLGMREAGVVGRAPEDQDYETFYVPAFARTLAVPRTLAMLKKGQALVWTANVAHGGSRIVRQGATRRSMVTHYYFENCLYYTPMRSEPERGRYDLRLPANLKTGLWVWPRREGRRAPLPLRTVKSALMQAVRRSVHIT
ncbi:phytanoyl-CoA dioxygenase family protein [Caulobacter sp. UNC358MFTsu5.1]|uniref:phytanoyl-CoA dioxygenase family protein n=1 Tax=Caulobacter sp. UNC358MFTsu5.1 TaxID=1449049 RepID=UPI0004A6CCFC|nr:phytanoyl-CoA dioxygenase family protein [Caulobacter sp. UNC358MFTsu5.1]